jgi:hypothetical protein
MPVRRERPTTPHPSNVPWVDRKRGSPPSSLRPPAPTSAGRSRRSRHRWLRPSPRRRSEVTAVTRGPVSRLDLTPGRHGLRTSGLRPRSVGELRKYRAPGHSRSVRAHHAARGTTVRVLPRSAACHSGTAAPSITVNPLPEHAEPSYRRSVEASVDVAVPNRWTRADDLRPTRRVTVLGQGQNRRRRVMDPGVAPAADRCGRWPAKQVREVRHSGLDTAIVDSDPPTSHSEIVRRSLSVTGPRCALRGRRAPRR